MARLELRGLNPERDIQLFREAHNWRTLRSKRASGQQMPFADFVIPSPTKAVMGLFNGDFLAAYTVLEYAPNHYDMHFTSNRKAPREYLVAGGILITSWLIEHGAIEVSAIIMERNRALKRFLEDCGYILEKRLTFTDSPHIWLRYVA